MGSREKKKKKKKKKRYDGKRMVSGLRRSSCKLDADIIVVPELSLTVPITNSLAFLFTVLGEWWADGKVISRGKLCVVKLFPSLRSGLATTARADGMG